MQKMQNVTKKKLIIESINKLKILYLKYILLTRA